MDIYIKKNNVTKTRFSSYIYNMFFLFEEIKKGDWISMYPVLNKERKKHATDSKRTERGSLLHQNQMFFLFFLNPNSEAYKRRERDWCGRRRGPSELSRCPFQEAWPLCFPGQLDPSLGWPFAPLNPPVRSQGHSVRPESPPLEALLWAWVW